MIYQSPKRTLVSVRDIIKGKVNDVCVCEDAESAIGNYYTLLVIHDHATVRSVLRILEAPDACGNVVLEQFADGGSFCILFPYRQSRPLSEFYMGNAFSLRECEMVCLGLIMECISSGLPYPFLYLVLTQGQIHLARDKSVYLSYELDLAEFDENRGEKDCVLVCAALLKELLEPKKKAKAISYRILELKVPKGSYADFKELYKDVKLAAVPAGRVRLMTRLREFWKYNQDRIFRILLVVCLMAGIVALLTVLSQLIFGDIPLYRIFSNPFKTIGTESLLQ